MLSTSMFDYVLPPELIAQHPAERRDGSRMLVLDRVTGECEIRPFGAIEEYISPGDALIYNDTKVLRGRMYARKNDFPVFTSKPLPQAPAAVPTPGPEIMSLIQGGKLEAKEYPAN